MDGARPRREMRPHLEALESILSLSVMADPAGWTSTASAGLRAGRIGANEVAPARRSGPSSVESVSPSPQTLQVRLTLDRKIYRDGQPIRITLTETAIGDRPVRLGGSPGYSLRAYSPGITWWGTQGPPLSMTNITYLRPGQSRQTSIVWNPRQDHSLPMPSGIVTIQGTLDGVETPPVSARLIGRA